MRPQKTTDETTDETTKNQDETTKNHDETMDETTKNQDETTKNHDDAIDDVNLLGRTLIILIVGHDEKIVCLTKIVAFCIHRFV